MKAFRFIIGFVAVSWFAIGFVFGQQSAVDFYNQGREKMAKGDFDGAIADFTQAIALDPKSFNSYNDRGFAKLHKNNLEEGITDFDQALTLNAKFSNSYYGRALAEQAKGDLNKAIADYRQVVILSTPETNYPHFYLWLVRVQQNQKTDADAELSAYLTKRPHASSGDWSSEIGGFLLGQISESDLMAAGLSISSTAGRDRARCEALYFAGMKRLLAGDKTAATDDFRKCLATNQTILTESPLAQAEAQALALNPGP